MLRKVIFYKISKEVTTKRILAYRKRDDVPFSLMLGLIVAVEGDIVYVDDMINKLLKV